MGLIRIDYHPSRTQLAVFGVLWLVFFGAIGAVVLGSGGSIGAAVGLWGLAVLVPAVGWIAPAFMRIVYVGMALAAFPVGFVVSHLVLAAVYYLVLTPIGLLMRAVGYDPLARDFDTDAQSYWVAREPTSDLRQYFRQF